MEWEGERGRFRTCGDRRHQPASSAYRRLREIPEAEQRSLADVRRASTEAMAAIEWSEETGLPISEFDDLYPQARERRILKLQRSYRDRNLPSLSRSQS